MTQSTFPNVFEKRQIRVSSCLAKACNRVATVRNGPPGSQTRLGATSPGAPGTEGRWACGDSAGLTLSWNSEILDQSKICHLKQNAILAPHLENEAPVSSSEPPLHQLEEGEERTRVNKHPRRKRILYPPRPLVPRLSCYSLKLQRLTEVESFSNVLPNKRLTRDSN